MSERKKIVLGWLAFGFVVFHVVNIMATAAPDGYVPNVVKRASLIYTNNVLGQKWNMFAPCPLIDGTFEAKFYYNGQETDWIRPVQDAVDFHRYFRFTHCSELSLSEANLIYWIHSDIVKDTLPIDREWTSEEDSKFKRAYSYSKVKNYTYGSCYYLFDQKPDSALARCFVRNVKTKEEGMAELPLMKWD